MSAEEDVEPPTRAEVERRWRNLISGRATREETAQWARARMFAEYEHKPELLVMSAIQQLDGFDLSHADDRSVVRHGISEGRVYYHSDEHVARELEHWLSDLASYDADPAGYLESIAERKRDRH